MVTTAETVTLYQSVVPFQEVKVIAEYRNGRRVDEAPAPSR